ncbi:MAG: hypothetical protein ACOZIN_09835 [Myxococcota bacterium]
MSSPALSAVWLWGLLALPNRPPVKVDIDACVDVSRPAVLSIIGIELGAALATPEEVSVRRTTVVEVTCKDQGVAVRVDDPLTHKVLKRSLDLAKAAPVTHTRLLALAIVELVAASWAELEWNPAPTLVAPEEHPTPAERFEALEALGPRTQGTSKTEQVTGLFGGRRFFAGSPWAWGGGARVGRHWGAVGWHCDLLAEFGSTDLAVGSVTVSTVSTGGSVLLTQRFAWFTAWAGPGLRVGAVQLTGNPKATDIVGHSVGGGWGGPLFNAGVSGHPGRRLIIELSGETGYALFPVVGMVEGERPVALDGVWLGAQLSVGLVL